MLKTQWKITLKMCVLMHFKCDLASSRFLSKLAAMIVMTKYVNQMLTDVMLRLEPQEVLIYLVIKKKIRQAEINRPTCFLLFLPSRIKCIISNQLRQLVFIPFCIPTTSKNNMTKPHWHIGQVNNGTKEWNVKYKSAKNVTGLATCLFCLKVLFEMTKMVSHVDVKCSHFIFK